LGSASGYLSNGGAGGATDYNYSGPPIGSSYSTTAGYNVWPGAGGTTGKFSSSNSYGGNGGAILLFW
jgi:hypothetical protein